MAADRGGKRKLAVDIILNTYQVSEPELHGPHLHLLSTDEVVWI